MSKAGRIVPGPQQESVWDYPRPPRLEDVPVAIRIQFNGVEIANTTHAKRVLETSHPPCYYIPPGDIQTKFLTPVDRKTYCEWKGTGSYYTLKVGDKEAKNVAWYYDDPTPEFQGIKNYVAFYLGPMDAGYVGEEKATPQPGGYYGGWITSKVVGPFKGERGTEFW